MVKPHLLLQASTILFIHFIEQQCKVFCFLHPDTSYNAFTYEAANFTPADEYDYIIVGGGTAGCPLATTLSQHYSVLLLERGGVPDLDPNILYEINSFTNLINANDKDSPAQNFTSEDGIPNVRGNVLGGSSMVNLGFYSRADDYFYKQSGIKWDMRNVEEAYEWIEDSIVSIPEALNTWQNSTLYALLESGVGPANGFTVQHLQGTKISGSTFDVSGTRHGAVQLLNKAYHENLRVVVHATVDRVIFAHSNLSDITATGVIYHDSKRRRHEVHVRRNGEVILSAGAIGSPQLLLLSGVGPRSYLLSRNITLVYQQPFVGQFMVDNPRIGITLVAPFPLADVGTRVVGITNNGLTIESSSGVTTFDSPANFLIFPDPYPPLNLSTVTISVEVMRIVSTGSLSLKSPTDVSVNPKVRFNYYSKSEDLVQCTNAVDAIQKMLRTHAMDLYKFKDRDGGKYFKVVGRSLPSNEESMETYCRETVRTWWHYHGGCLVNKVVDNDLKVMGINGLRVIDGSIFSEKPGTNPQATAMMLGRYIGMKIQNVHEPEKMDYFLKI